MLHRWFHRKGQAQNAGDALLKVFAMFKFTPSQVIKIGSIGHLVEMFGINKREVPRGIQYLLEKDLLVREGGSDLYLTQLGWERCMSLAPDGESGDGDET